LLHELRRRAHEFLNPVKIRDDFLHPINYLKNIILRSVLRKKREFVPWMPQNIFISHGTLCNLRCEMCANRFLPKDHCGSLSFEGFRRILDHFEPNQTRSVIFPGSGEPLLNPDFIEMLKYAKNRGFETEMFTNGTLIDRTNVKDLVENLDQVRFSVDGAKKETYEAIRKGANFEKTMENISLFIKAKKDYNSKVATHIDFVCMVMNCDEIVDIVSLAHKLGIANVNMTMVRKMFPGKDIDGYDDKIKDMKVKYESLQYLLKKAIILSKKYELGFSVTYSERFAPKCNWPWLSCFISHDGFVTPCCLCHDPSIINFGNLSQTPFSKIWNNVEYRKFRRNLMRGVLPDVCEKCGL